jgi:hypothetical protein
VAENALAPIIYDLMTDHQLDAADLPLVFKALLERFSPKA